MKKKLVAFDFDGVIANSWEVVLGIVQLVDPEMSDDEYKQRFYGNMGETVGSLTEKLGYDFFDEYEAKAGEVPLFDGMREVIEKLAEEYVLVIVSSTRTDILDAFLRVHNLRGHFTGLYGSTQGFNKSKKLQRALIDNDVALGHSLFITDTLGDLREAEAVGMMTIAVSWGYHRAEVLQAGWPKVVVDRPEEIVGAVGRLLQEV